MCREMWYTDFNQAAHHFTVYYLYVFLLNVVQRYKIGVCGDTNSVNIIIILRICFLYLRFIRFFVLCVLFRYLLAYSQKRIAFLYVCFEYLHFIRFFVFLGVLLEYLLAYTVVFSIW